MHVRTVDLGGIPQGIYMHGTVFLLLELFTVFCMGFCVDGNAMDSDTLDQWSGIELLRVFLLKIFFKNFKHS